MHCFHSNRNFSPAILDEGVNIHRPYADFCDTKIEWESKYILKNEFIRFGLRMSQLFASFPILSGSG